MVGGWEASMISRICFLEFLVMVVSVVDGLAGRVGSFALIYWAHFIGG